MSTRPRETSAEVATRFVARRQRARELAQQRRAERKRQRARRNLLALSRGPAAPPERPQRARRIVLDLAEPTLRAIQAALFEQIAGGGVSGDLLNSTLEAEVMVSRALGDRIDPEWEHVDDRHR